MEFEDKITLDNNYIVVLIDVTGDKAVENKDANSNIICLDKDHNIIWRISADEGTYERDSFVELNIEKCGTITARRFFGKTYEVDPSNGKAELTGWQK